MENTRTIALAGLLVAAGAFATGTAHADEAGGSAHNGPSVALVNAGRIDDPVEDVLERVAVPGRNVITD